MALNHGQSSESSVPILAQSSPSARRRNAATTTSVVPPEYSCTYPLGFAETYHGTVYEVIQNVVPKLLSAGYQLVTIADCLGVDPYQSVSSPGKRDSTWTCDGKLRTLFMNLVGSSGQARVLTL